MPDQIRVLRVLEYVGRRDVVESELAKALRNGTHTFRHGQIVLKVATLGDFPEILEEGNPT